MKRFVLALCLLAAITGCAEDLREIGRPPRLSSIDTDVAVAQESSTDLEQPPSGSRGYTTNGFARWDNVKGDLFSGKLATSPGDILTINVRINDRARFNNRSDSSRTVGRGINAAGQFSIEGLGRSADGDATVGSTTTFDGSGGTTRSESIELSIAVVVQETFANGNLLVRGTQEVRVNSELRVLTIEGVVRPSDIEPDNTISYERIAEARISYGGRGHVSHVQRPPYGQQILNRILPF